MNSSLEPGSYSRNLWLEISDFDTREDDFGVNRYLDEVGFVPGYVSFLISSPDFVLQHGLFGEEDSLPDDFCSYGGRWCFNPERGSRPPWTRQRIKQLISCFQQQGVAVYFSVFDQFLDNQYHSEWASAHPEVLALLRTGERVDSINPLIRLKDGSYYEDFFNRQMVEVFQHYGFDGFHCADGCNHLRSPLYWSDYSDDMVRQFVEATGVQLPAELSEDLNGESVRFEKRAEWIWRNSRESWVRFYADRWTSHMKKQAAAVHSAGGRLVFNTTWTRDPFEALYRWGIDYRRLAEVGVDEFVVECPGSGNDIGGEGGIVYPNFYFKILANILLTRAAMPAAKIIALHHTHDVQENYEILRHAPTYLEKEAYTYPNLFFKDNQVRISRCLDGFFVCLAADIRPDEWKAMRENWNNSFSGTPVAVSGATVIYSPAAFENQMRDVIETRNATTHNLLYRLLAKGAPIYSVADIESVEKLSGPLVVLNSHHFPEGELNALLAYTGGPLVVVGKGALPTADPAAVWTDGNTEGALTVSVFHGQPVLAQTCSKDGDDDAGEPAVGDPWGIVEPMFYCVDLPSQKITDGFLRTCAALICQVSGSFLTSNSETVQTSAVKIESGPNRVFIRNNRWAYSEEEIEMEGKIQTATVVTRFPYRPLEPVDGRFRVKIPPQGVVCVDVKM